MRFRGKDARKFRAIYSKERLLLRVVSRSCKIVMTEGFLTSHPGVKTFGPYRRALTY